MIKIGKYLTLAFLGLLLTSCLTNSEQNDLPNQLLLTLEFSNINNEIVAQDDTLRILALRFLYGRTSLRNANDTLLVNNNILQVTHQVTNDEIKGLANGTFNSDEIFSTLAFEIKQAEESDTGENSNFDENAFIEGSSNDQRYSMIINGSYNNNEFVYKSTRNFNFEFFIEDDSEGTGGNLLYNLPLATDVNSWFLNDNGDGLLDPRTESNASAINDNIEESLHLN